MNLGPASQFKSVQSGTTVTLTLGNLAADFTAVFGADWYTRQNLGGGSAILWGIDPAWDPIRYDPDFQKLISEPEPETVYE